MLLPRPIFIPSFGWRIASIAKFIIKCDHFIGCWTVQQTERAKQVLLAVVTLGWGGGVSVLLDAV